jgi:hypothetical protein
MAFAGHFFGCVCLTLALAELWTVLDQRKSHCWRDVWPAFVVIGVVLLSLQAAFWVAS